jgi:hypothetical protein
MTNHSWPFTRLENRTSLFDIFVRLYDLPQFNIFVLLRVPMGLPTIWWGPPCILLALGWAVPRGRWFNSTRILLAWIIVIPAIGGLCAKLRIVWVPIVLWKYVNEWYLIILHFQTCILHPDLLYFMLPLKHSWPFTRPRKGNYI